MNNNFAFDRAAIKKNCDDFYAMYKATKDEVYKMCSRKIIHTYEVAKNCRIIAGEMGMSVKTDGY